MACGCPVISSNTASVPEVVGNAGILINPESEEEITGAINKMLESPETRKEMKKKNAEQAAKL